MPGLEMFQVTQGDISRFDRNINNFMYALKKFMEKHPELSSEEAVELYKNKNLEFLNTLLQRNSVRSDTFRLTAIDELLDSNYGFLACYNEVIRGINSGKYKLDEKSNLFFSLNREDCKTTHVLDSIIAARHQKAEFLKSMNLTEWQYDKFDLKKFIKGHPGQLDKETIATLQFYKKSEFERVVINTKEFKESFVQKIRDNYVDTISDYYTHFKEMGYMDKYLANHNSTFPSDLALTEEDLEKFFDKENLNTLPLTNLAALYAFYSNRYTKELQNLEDGMFVLSKGFSIDTLLSAETPSEEIPHLNKRVLIREKEFLTDLSDRILSGEYAKANSKENVEKTNQSFFSSTVDLRRYEKENQEYQRIFGKKEKEFFQTLSQIFSLRNYTRNEYKLKDYSLLATLSTIASSKSVSNWGIILDDDYPDSNFYLLGFDIQGLNMPLRLHIPKDMIEDFSREYFKSEFFPLYDGDSDFRYNFKKVSTPLLIGQPEKHRETLREKVSRINKEKPLTSNDKFYSHLLYLADKEFTSVPDHLKTTVVEGKKGKKKEKLKYVRNFVSLKTGEVFTEKQLPSIYKSF